MCTKHRPSTPHLGDGLHVRNRYKHNPPDFYAIGMLYPSFQRYLRQINHEKKAAVLPFDDPEAVRELTKTLLLHDFYISNWNIPIDRLCPPLPNRLNYLHWIEDMLQQSGIDPFPSTIAMNSIIRGIDIGTGASCIYPLLGARMNQWHFLATEIDATSFDCAQANVNHSGLQQYITLKHVSTVRVLQEPLQDILAAQHYHFSMCNPPFFDHIEEADTNPSTCCMGNTSEMLFPGGEVAFIGNMIIDSLELRDRVLIYTSMIGRKGSLRKLLAQFRQHQITNVATTEFLQGRTKRWGIAWSFSSEIVLSSQKKVLGKRKEAHRRQKLAFQVPVWSPDTADYGCRTLQEVNDRVLEFVDSYSPSSEHNVSVLEIKSAEARRVYRVACRKVANTNDDSQRAVFQGRIVCEMENNESFGVVIEFEEGERGKFWSFTDCLQGATIRSGRQWRRKRLVEENALKTE